MHNLMWVAQYIKIDVCRIRLLPELSVKEEDIKDYYCIEDALCRRKCCTPKPGGVFLNSGL